MSEAHGDSFPYRRTCPMRPPVEYDELRRSPAQRVVLASGRVAWLVSGYDSIRQVLSSPDVSSNMAHPGYPLQFEAPVEVIEQMRPVLLASDPPQHTGQRRLVAGEFTARRMRELRPRIERIVDDQIAELLSHDHAADLVDVLAVPVPSFVICELLGVPPEDRSFFQQRTKQLVTIDTDPVVRQDALAALMGYLSDLLDEKSRSGTGDDLLGRLIAKNGESGVLDREQMLGLANVLLVGGHETTANMISLGVVGLLEHPEQLATWNADEDRAGRVVDELLRYFSIADQVTSRAALADIPLDGVTIPAGEGIIALTASGNHDADVFEDPHRFDIDRAPRSHLAFGHGIHQCVGQHLAKLELEVVLTRLFRRVPSLRLALPVEELPFKDSTGVYGLHRLPVVW